jgi:hypothetical protein
VPLIPLPLAGEGGARRVSGGRVRGCECLLAPLCKANAASPLPLIRHRLAAGATFSRVGEKGGGQPSPWWGGWTALVRWPGGGMRRCRILLALVVERPAPHPWPSPRGGGGNGHGCAAGVGCLGGRRSEGTECLAGVPGNVACVRYAEVRMAAAGHSVTVGYGGWPRFPGRAGGWQPSSDGMPCPAGRSAKRRLVFPPRGGQGPLEPWQSPLMT